MPDTAASTTPERSPLGALKLGARSSGKGRRKRRLWPWALGLVAVAAAAFVLWGQRRAEVQSSAVQTAYPSAQYAQLTASGYVVAQRRAAVSSKATGRLLELRVREGSTVKSGDLIARLDASDVQAAVQSAQAGVAQSLAGLRQAEAGVAQTRVEQANADAELQRALGLQAQGFISAQGIDAARRRADAARASVVTAQAAVGLAQASQALAAAQLKAQTVNRDNTEIRAPFDGVVLVKNANVGDMITPFSSAAGSQGAVVTMADMGTLEVEADVSEANVGKVRADQPVEITLDALPELRLAGSVARIVPTVDRAKATVMTKIRFARIDPRVLPEMSAKVVFLSQAPGPADATPVAAVNPKTVVDRDGSKTVFRIADGSVQAVAVTPGRALGDALEITGGALKPGDKLVLSPGEKIRSGDKVTVSGK